MTILRGFKVDCLDVNLTPTNSRIKLCNWYLFLMNLKSQPPDLKPTPPEKICRNGKWSWTIGSIWPALKHFWYFWTVQPVLFWWWFEILTYSKYCLVERYFWNGRKGWVAQEAVFLNGDIDNFLLFPQKKFPRDKNHFDVCRLISMGKAEKTNPAWTDFETKIPWNFEEIFRL